MEVPLLVSGGGPLSDLFLIPGRDSVQQLLCGLQSGGTEQ